MEIPTREECYKRLQESELLIWRLGERHKDFIQWIFTAGDSVGDQYDKTVSSFRNRCGGSFWPFFFQRVLWRLMDFNRLCARNNITTEYRDDLEGQYMEPGAGIRAREQVNEICSLISQIKRENQRALAYLRLIGLKSAKQIAAESGAKSAGSIAAEISQSLAQLRELAHESYSDEEISEMISHIHLTDYGQDHAREVVGGDPITIVGAFHG